MFLKNAKIFDSDFNLVQADVSIREGKIDGIAPELKGGESIDLSGCLIAPGFVDIHIHGCNGADTCDGTREAIGRMARHLIQKGVTSFCPTTMTVAQQKIRTALSTVRGCMERPPEGASVCGANLEGPYISAERRGAQGAEYIRKPDWLEFKKWFEECGGIIKLLDVAPECDGARELIERASTCCRVSLAHTMADYDQVKDAFGFGITHVTHLFNAMEGLRHREPGAVGAVFDDSRVRAEMICDGFHIHPAVLRIAFRMLGEDRTVIVSDSMRAAGLPDGVSELGGQTVFIKDGRARLSDGTIAGSTTNLHEEVKNLIRFGIPIRQVIKSATINPASAIGKEREIGSIEVGKDADLVVMDENYDIRMVIGKGSILFSKPRA
jgi:N-acetylglucosamine-6-phosphate deacetylase